MHRQGETELFDACPICKEKAQEYKRIDVRDGVWFTCCPTCFSGIRAFMLHGSGPFAPHPALASKGNRRRRKR